MKIFLDINIALDVLMQRSPDVTASAKLLDLCAKRKIQGYLSATSYGILHYILRKSLSRTETLSLLKELNKILHTVDLTQAVIAKSLASDFSDFEDALQYFCALSKSVDTIITRDTKGFKLSQLVVQTPENFLVHFSS